VHHVHGDWEWKELEMSEVQRSREELAEAELREREAHYYRLFAGALCVAALTFGLLNLWGVIKM
jgi:hypothetical protein